MCAVRPHLLLGPLPLCDPPSFICCRDVPKASDAEMDQLWGGAEGGARVLTFSVADGSMLEASLKSELGAGRSPMMAMVCAPGLSCF